MNILYVDHGGRTGDSYLYQYYGDLYRELKKAAHVQLYEGHIIDFSRDDWRAWLRDKNFNCIIFGLGYFALRDPTAYKELKGLKEVDIPVVCLLHKPQTLLKEKLSFCKVNNIDLLVDSQITYKQFAELLGTPPIRIWFSATPEIYYPRDVEVLYDVGFCGASHGDGKIQGETANLRDRIYQKILPHNLSLFWNRQTKPSDRIDSVEEYATKINQCKMWIATTGPTLDVSPRYFEVMLSKTLLLCNKMPLQYENVFQDGVNCVMFENDLSDFDEKINYYLNNDEERNRIIESAYDTALNNYTSEHMAIKLLNKIKEL